MCYYKLDYYDVSQEVLAVYLQNFPDSVVGINLKACNHFRLYNGKAAEIELNSLTEKITCHFQFAEDLIKHNLVYIYFICNTHFFLKKGCFSWWRRSAANFASTYRCHPRSKIESCYLLYEK